MEGIFEALLQFLIETVFEIAVEIIGGMFEYIISFDFSGFLNRRLPGTVSFSDEITTLHILS